MMRFLVTLSVASVFTAGTLLIVQLMLEMHRTTPALYGHECPTLFGLAVIFAFSGIAAVIGTWRVTKKI